MGVMGNLDAVALTDQLAHGCLKCLEDDVGVWFKIKTPRQLIAVFEAEMHIDRSFIIQMPPASKSTLSMTTKKVPLWSD